MREFIGGTTGNTRGQSIGATLDVTAGFLKQNGISRISDTGYTLLESWDPTGAKFKSGGTVFVKVAGADAADLKEVPYGFTINAKGGLVDAETMSCDFDFTISSIVGKDGDSIERQEESSKQKISLPIGKTTLIGGRKGLIDQNTPPSGLPILRNTPVVNWFVADSGKSVSDRRLVIMVCPELVDNTQDAKPDVDKEINIRVQDQGAKDTDQVIEERKEEKHSGFWYWLNWFEF
jgi:type II secretory pathway component GspD/PulD (secretin)